jgi:hypothetical protein
MRQVSASVSGMATSDPSGCQAGVQSSFDRQNPLCGRGVLWRRNNFSPMYPLSEVNAIYQGNLAKFSRESARNRTRPTGMRIHVQAHGGGRPFRLCRFFKRKRTEYGEWAIVSICLL